MDVDKKEGLCVTAGPQEDGMTARGVLRRTKGVSQRLIRKIVHGEGENSGALYINDRPARFHDKVRSGDKLRLVLPEESSWIEPYEMPITVLYEDEDILVIDKKPGMVVHPTKGHREGTLAGGIVFHMRERGENYKPRFVSRLDMDTSGVLLVGKNSHVQNNLAKQSAAGGVEKYYHAILSGRLEDDLPSAGVIDLPIGLMAPGEPRRGVLPEEDGGFASQTAYEILKTFYPAQRNGTEASDFKGVLTLIRVRLLTGRTHQIRVHFSHCGYPILGDHLYGCISPLITRQALHASEIAFVHPANGRALRFHAPLPADISALI